MSLHDDTREPRAVILAGGEGSRLRALTQRIAGDDRPKQFCAIADGETLLERTRQRAQLSIRGDRHVIAVTHDHARYFAPLRDELLPDRLVIQPTNQGTVAGILYPILRVQALAGDAPVAILPSDHDIREDRAFMAYVDHAMHLIRALRDHVILLGIQAEDPETEYGWVEPAQMPIPMEGPEVFPIQRFWEKPSLPLARILHARGCLWNSFVMIGWASAFLDLIHEALPDVGATFAPLRHAVGTRREAAAAEEVYALLSPMSFSERVLTRLPARLLTLRVKDVGWSDWGQPGRVLAALRRSGRRPDWLTGGELAFTA